jgi:hypothetical protein
MRGCNRTLGFGVLALWFVMWSASPPPRDKASRVGGGEHEEVETETETYPLQKGVLKDIISLGGCNSLVV